ncbi:hypothetical protein [Cerasicoccus arenae]|uniref:Uncharacterized protein n=1 Tax=Cerasicoccus arenae TaxID=424488 RepID=A0A8J3DGK5_9BACT|nr:hypothetical protein [Cerasicoccus arenae]MBK1856734.1 hypothetical protein [Cerasicoccus arenae]GHB99185.1 hypothetical protein GCM10007047_14160 [Cerasicoccus arenae]
MSDEKKLIDFMREEIARTRKGVGHTYLFGIIAAVLVAGYMAFILSMVKQATDGEFLAIAVRQQVEQAVPDMIHSGEMTLAKNASISANKVSNRFKQLVPKFAATGKEKIDMSYQDQIPYLSEEFNDMVRLYIKSNEVELREFANQHDSQEFAEEFTRQMMAEFALQIDIRMKDATGGNGLNYFNENLLQSLVAMDTTLGELLNKPEDQLTQRERLQRRILARMVLHITSHTPPNS